MPHKQNSIYEHEQNSHRITVAARFSSLMSHKLFDMQNNQQNRGRQEEQGVERDENSRNNIQEQQNNENLNTASQQPVQNLRDKNVGSGRSYDYGADYSPEQDPERDPSRG